MCVKKAEFFKDSSKIERTRKKASIKLITSSEQRKRLLF